MPHQTPLSLAWLVLDRFPSFFPLHRSPRIFTETEPLLFISPAIFVTGKILLSISVKGLVETLFLRCILSDRPFYATRNGLNDSLGLGFCLPEPLLHVHRYKRDCATRLIHYSVLG